LKPDIVCSGIARVVKPNETYTRNQIYDLTNDFLDMKAMSRAEFKAGFDKAVDRRILIFQVSEKPPRRIEYLLNPKPPPVIENLMKDVEAALEGIFRVSPWLMPFHAESSTQHLEYAQDENAKEKALREATIKANTQALIETWNKHTPDKTHTLNLVETYLKQKPQEE